MARAAGSGHNAPRMRPPTPSDPPLRRAMLDRREVAWAESGPGDGPAVVMIHGAPGSQRDFRWLAPPLAARGIRVIRLDMPGFGASAGEPVAIPEVAAHLRRRLDLLELDRAVLLGHSLGGASAMLGACADPSRVRGLVLLASIGLRPHRGFRKLEGLPIVNRGLKLPVLRRPLMWAVEAVFRRAGFSSRVSQAEIRRTLALVETVDFEALKAAVRRLECPTAVIYSQDDPLIEAAIPEQLGLACPHGPRLRFESGGHNPQKPWACEIAERIGPWIHERLRLRALPPG